VPSFGSFKLARLTGSYKIGRCSTGLLAASLRFISQVNRRKDQPLSFALLRSLLCSRAALLCLLAWLVAGCIRHKLAAARIGWFFTTIRCGLYPTTSFIYSIPLSPSPLPNSQRQPVRAASRPATRRKHGCAASQATMMHDGRAWGARRDVSSHLLCFAFCSLTTVGSVTAEIGCT